MKPWLYASVAGALLLAGCQSHDNLMSGPELTPVGYGVNVATAPVPTSFAAAGPSSLGSTWGGQGVDLFRDIRAAHVGDVLTVLIQINDQAQFDNATDRSRDGNADFGFFTALSAVGFGAGGGSGEVSADLGIDSSTSSSGEGSIDRSEKLRLSVAAVVLDKLPNGNLLISGSQEIRVNYEVRVLNIAGIVRPLDISDNNTIPYDKIAEARISYGGRGRLTDMQQPAWGQRVYDKVAPF
ncbi:flagellar basal body L-ring protein FlgH [Amorphus orientalis]|uniref:Flagellar L-ring protein n=1 Tax=Amorphus orientalis TaxID=649198 RepID=A0AAE3VSL2_9HYPH|nr:flagellar basal body L-ring protein FlgH [Amorphus orientalis]MDQ0317597.1 flagellar L-ring protein precursor FlgH [Amorphus orientalis]